MAHLHPAPESITVHPVDRDQLNQQLPTSMVYGQPLPPDLPIIEDHNILPGTLRIRLQGKDHTVTLGRMPQARWILADPVTGRPLTDPGPIPTSR